jgi:histidyl-tRNA synthetase
MGSIQASRGTRDILPDEMRYWQHVESIARDIFARAAYQEIRTPIFEQTNLFERGIGEATDVVGKEMYTFKDRGDRSLTLRPEGTAGAVRAFIEHSLSAQGGVQRLWYGGAMFRYERPQAGRQRQFHQIGVEALGSASPRADVEVIALFAQILQTLGLKSVELNLNSIGDSSDRQHYRQALVAYLTPYYDELDPDSRDRLTRNPLRILDSKAERTQEILQHAPNVLEYLSPESQQRFEQVQALLSAIEIPYVINPRLVRGLDYYSHTVFEIISADLGAQATVGGGGRYDGLVSELGGVATPAVGWAFGMERLILLLQQLQPLPLLAMDVYMISKGEKAEAQALVLAQRLRQQSFAVELDLSGSAFGKQFKRADRSGAVVCLILGDDEAEHQTVQIKWLTSGEQTAIAQADLLHNLDGFRHQVTACKANR